MPEQQVLAAPGTRLAAFAAAPLWIILVLSYSCLPFTPEDPESRSAAAMMVIIGALCNFCVVFVTLWQCQRLMHSPRACHPWRLGVVFNACLIVAVMLNLALISPFMEQVLQPFSPGNARPGIMLAGHAPDSLSTLALRTSTFVMGMIPELFQTVFWVIAIPACAAAAIRAGKRHAAPAASLPTTFHRMQMLTLGAGLFFIARETGVELEASYCAVMNMPAGAAPSFHLAAPLLAAAGTGLLGWLAPALFQHGSGARLFSLGLAVGGMPALCITLSFPWAFIGGAPEGCSRLYLAYGGYAAATLALATVLGLGYAGLDRQAPRQPALTGEAAPQ